MQARGASVLVVIGFAFSVVLMGSRLNDLIQGKGVVVFLLEIT